MGLRPPRFTSLSGCLSVTAKGFMPRPACRGLFKAKSVKKIVILGLIFCGFYADAQPQIAPLTEIAGRWTNDVQISGQSQFTQSENFFWVGKFWGVVDSTGKFRFSSENGCKYEGLAYPYFSWWEGQASVTNCPNPSMNRMYSIQFRKTGSFLSFSGSATSIGPGRVEGAYALKGTLSRY